MALIKVEVVVGGCCTRVAYYDQCHRQYVSYPSEGGRPSRTSHSLGVSDVIYISIVANGFLSHRHLVSSI
jgi:hypothetical protein